MCKNKIWSYFRNPHLGYLANSVHPDHSAFSEAYTVCHAVCAMLHDLVDVRVTCIYSLNIASDGYFYLENCHYLGLEGRKPVFRGLQATKRRPACASAQTDQRICYLFFGKYHIWTCYKQNFNFLASLCS